jgi:hypothetical protein
VLKAQSVVPVLSERSFDVHHGRERDLCRRQKTRPSEDLLERRNAQRDGSGFLRLLSVDRLSDRISRGDEACCEEAAVNEISHAHDALSSWPVRLSGGPRAQGDPKARRQRGTGEIILVVLGAGAETAQSERGKYRGGWLKDELGA